MTGNIYMSCISIKCLIVIIIIVIISYSMTLKFSCFYVTSGFNRGVKRVFALLECYAASIGGYWLFGAAFGKQRQGSSEQCFTLEAGIDRLSRNVANLTGNEQCVTSQKREDLIVVILVLEWFHFYRGLSHSNFLFDLFRSLFSTFGMFQHQTETCLSASPAKCITLNF
jgi:hypothetical protein